jgi:nicotinamide riboside kinase
MKVINLFGGPGAGKSTTAAGVFWLLKNRGLRVELVTEYAKALAWAKRGEELTDQFYIYAKQHHRQHVLKGQVDFLVTDSPLLLTLLYVGDLEPDSYCDYVVDNWKRYDNVNFIINRVKPYHTEGRWQSLEEAQVIDKRIETMLKEIGERYYRVDGNEYSAIHLVRLLETLNVLEPQEGKWLESTGK